MPALSSHLHGHHLVFPFLAIVVCPMPPYRVLSKSLPASQADRTSGYNLLNQLSALPVRNRTQRDIPQRTSPGPSAASWPFLSSLPFSFHPAQVLHLLSALFIFTLSHLPFLFFHKAFFFLFLRLVCGQFGQKSHRSLARKARQHWCIRAKAGALSCLP